MSALDPIAGISLERYAELCALMKDCGGDLGVCAQIAEKNGVAANVWKAAMDGWNHRMQDPSTAGQVALAYMPLYQAALANTGGVASTSFENYVGMLAMVNSKRHGPDAMYAHYGITVHDWSQISSYWVGQVTTDPQLGAKLSNLMVPLQQQLDAGAPPPPVHQGDAPAVSKDEVVGAAQKFSTDLQNKMQGASGGAPPPPPPPAPSAALTMGSGCMVQWSDGNQYPGTVKQLSGAHALVAFPNGREEWIEQKLVSPA